MSAPIVPGPIVSAPIVSPEWLADAVTHSDLVVADVRWYLDGRSGRTAFEAGHIAGARFVDLDTDLSDHSQPATAGRHPLPSPEHFAAALRRLGIGDDTTVVAYDDSGGGTAGRLVVMLRVLGCDAALLDGGLKGWPGSLQTGPSPVPKRATFTARAWPAHRFATADEVAAVGSTTSGTDRHGLVLDARSADRYRGDTEPVDPRAGHIPGALNAPWTANVDPATGRFKDPVALRAHYEALGATDDTDIVCYCGSGVSAAADVLGIEHAGLGVARLFVGSWSGWSSDPHRPIAAGPPS